MSSAHWTGPYCAAHGPDGTTLAWNPLTDRRPPRQATRFVVRWRVDALPNPRKRTFRDAVTAETWARHIEAARILRLPCDHRGWPIEYDVSAPLDRDSHSGSVPSPEQTVIPLHGPTSHPFGEDGPPPFSGCATDVASVTLDGYPIRAAEPRRAPMHQPATLTSLYAAPVSDRSDTEVVLGETVATRVEVSQDNAVALPSATGFGVDVATYIDELISLYRPVWEQQGHDGLGVRWWIGQLEFIRAVLRYAAGDRELDHPGIEVGDSVHLSLIGERHLNRALQLRRTVNLRVLHQNAQRQGKYDRALATYETKIAAREARTGYRGRKPAPPALPKQEVAVAEDGRVLVSTHAEKAFRTSMSFVFDRAFEAGLFPPGPNPYRRWNPRGSGGRHAAHRSPFRSVRKATADSRSFPGLGFWVDVGDALAGRGEGITSGLNSGERYRVLPLAWVQIAPRPGEGRRIRADHLRDTTVLIAPEADGHLKLRAPGESRTVPLSRLVSSLLAEHAAAGLAGPDGVLFLSPHGQPLDPTNFYEDFLRPAISAIAGPEKLWAEYPALRAADFYDLRKAGITHWVTGGADTYEAGRWSGHTEHELLTSYRGVIDGIGRRAQWTDIDTMVEQALLADPPRGNGALATRLREWLN